MFLFGYDEKLDRLLQCFGYLAEAMKDQNRLLREILHRLPSHRHRTFYADVYLGEEIMAATPGTQAVGATLKATFVPIEADGVTQTPGATLSTPPSYSISDPTVATLVDNGDGTATITGVAAGTVTITASNGVFTDSDGTVSSPLTATNTDTVTGGVVIPPTGRTTSAQINFA